MKIKKYQYLKSIYPNIHDDIYNNTKDVIYFIKKHSSPDIIPYPITKIITFEVYNKAYKDRHIKICEYYGDFNPNIYEKSIKKIESLIDEESEKDKLKKKDSHFLKKSFKIFGLFRFGTKNEGNKYSDILDLDRLLIKEYMKNSFYKDLNKYLINFESGSYDAVAYFTARLMYSLNSYAKEKKCFTKKKISFFTEESNYLIVHYYFMKELKIK